MTHATIRISAYISAQGPVVSEDPLSGLVTIRDGARLLRGRRIAPPPVRAAAA